MHSDSSHKLLETRRVASLVASEARAHCDRLTELLVADMTEAAQLAALHKELSRLLSRGHVASHLRHSVEELLRVQTETPEEERLEELRHLASLFAAYGRPGEGRRIRDILSREGVSPADSLVMIRYELSVLADSGSVPSGLRLRVRGILARMAD